MTGAPFIVTHEGAVAHLRFTRPQAANAMTLRFWDEFPHAVAELDAGGETRALVISGEGRNFCAGMDVSVFESDMLQPDRSASEREAFVHSVRKFQAALTCLARARFPVVAAIQGACVGGGLDLAVACDLRFVSADAYFRVEEINIGMMADLGSLERGARALPQAKIREMAFCGRTLRAEEAVALGFVNAIAADPLVAAFTAAREVAARSPLAVAASKAALNYAADHALADSLEHTALLQAAMWSSAEVRAAMTARAKKSAAEFAGLKTLTR